MVLFVETVIQHSSSLLKGYWKSLLKEFIERVLTYFFTYFVFKEFFKKSFEIYLKKKTSILKKSFEFFFKEFFNKLVLKERIIKKIFIKK